MHSIDPSDFEVENGFIGEGNFSQVSLVHPKDNINLKVALKKIPVDPDNEDIENIFKNEVSILSSLQHPNIQELIGYSYPSDEDQTFKIYSKYVPNSTLGDILTEDQLSSKNKILNSTQLSIIVYGIASAMSYLHSKKIVHRDLKPENIFLDENFYPVLSDFGLSRFCDDNFNIADCLGTPYFMAPELFLKEEVTGLSNKIDVYAFGVTLLSLFTTNYKFEGMQPRTITQLINKVTSGKRFVIPKEVPNFYANLIQRCWANDPEERPSFDKIVEELEQNNEFIFEGSNVEEVKKYIKQTKNIDEINKRKELLVISSSSSPSSSDDEINFENDNVIYTKTEEYGFNYF